MGSFRQFEVLYGIKAGSSLGIAFVNLGSVWWFTFPYCIRRICFALQLPFLFDQKPPLGMKVFWSNWRILFVWLFSYVGVCFLGSGSYSPLLGVGRSFGVQARKYMLFSILTFLLLQLCFCLSLQSCSYVLFFHVVTFYLFSIQCPKKTKNKQKEKEEKSDISFI